MNIYIKKSTFTSSFTCDTAPSSPSACFSQSTIHTMPWSATACHNSTARISQTWHAYSDLPYLSSNFKKACLVYYLDISCLHWNLHGRLPAYPGHRQEMVFHQVSYMLLPLMKRLQINLWPHSTLLWAVKSWWHKTIWGGHLRKGSNGSDAGVELWPRQLSSNYDISRTSPHSTTFYRCQSGSESNWSNGLLWCTWPWQLGAKLFQGNNQPTNQLFKIAPMGVLNDFPCELQTTIISVSSLASKCFT